VEGADRIPDAQSKPCEQPSSVILWLANREIKRSSRRVPRSHAALGLAESPKALVERRSKAHQGRRFSKRGSRPRLRRPFERRLAARSTRPKVNRGFADFSVLWGFRPRPCRPLVCRLYFHGRPFIVGMKPKKKNPPTEGRALRSAKRSWECCPLFRPPQTVGSRHPCTRVLKVTACSGPWAMGRGVANFELSPSSQRSFPGLLG